MPSKHFSELLAKMQEIHDKKSHDYAKDSDPLSNFKFSADTVKHFNNPIDQVFAGIIAIKLSRLSELLNGKEAKNESTTDTFIDLANYTILWAAYYLENQDKVQGINLGNHPPFESDMLIGIDYSRINRDMTNSIRQPVDGLYGCPKCVFSTKSKSALISHAQSMHSAKFHVSGDFIQYNDCTQKLS
jgi:hypothetical protein